MFLGRQIVNMLRSQVVLVCVDEAHTCLETQWGSDSMHENMRRAPAFLKAQFQTTTKAPVLAMTASAQAFKTKKSSKSEIEEIASTCSIHNTSYMTIYMTPIISSQLYVRLSKPPAIRGFDGELSHSTSKNVTGGSVDILLKIYLGKFIECIENGQTPKKAIIYVNNLNHLSDMNEYLLGRLGHLPYVRNPNTCPWVINSTCAGRSFKVYQNTLFNLCLFKTKEKHGNLLPKSPV